MDKHRMLNKLHIWCIIFIYNKLGLICATNIAFFFCWIQCHRFQFKTITYIEINWERILFILWLYSTAVPFFVLFSAENVVWCRCWTDQICCMVLHYFAKNSLMKSFTIRGSSCWTQWLAPPTILQQKELKYSWTVNLVK